MIGNICNWLLQGNGAADNYQSDSILQNPCKMNLTEDYLAVLGTSLNPWIIYEELLA